MKKQENPRKIDIMGQRFGRWLVVSYAGSEPKRGGALWNCVCDCGNSAVVVSLSLRKGVSASCGCLGTEKRALSTRTHGMAGTRLHRIWKGMRKRCNNPNGPRFEHYGGRGIKVCEEWSNFKNFNDWAMLSGYQDDLTIERVDVNLGYAPSNCTWIPLAQQAVNRNYTNKAPDGQLWSHKAVANGIPRTVYASRIHRGYSPEEASTRPLGRWI